MSGWQPIETAPKDGTAILAYGPLPSRDAGSGVRETHWKAYPEGSPGWAKWKEGKGPIGIGWDWYEPVHNWSHTWSPTHWMQIPPMPVAA